MAAVIGFTKPSEAVEFARANNVALAFLDIELGTISGLDLCRALPENNPRTNVVYGYQSEILNIIEGNGHGKERTV